MHDPTKQEHATTARAGPRSLLEALLCPRCATAIDGRSVSIVCPGCGKSYPRLGEIPVLLPEPERYLGSCRRQLALLDEQGGRTIQKIRKELQGADVLPMTRRRCGVMIEALQGQIADLRAILEPLVRDDAPQLHVGDPSEHVPATMEYLPYLYRDWGWPPEADGENERALAAVEGVIEGRPLGRTLVVGAGGCRLAYDLHRRHPEAEIAVIDVDPVLFAVAHAVARGRSVAIREANLEICDMAHTVKEWVLKAPSGPVNDDRFHFFLADGLEPPFAPGIWDTVVTPWFIDQVPADVRDFMSTLHRLLKPGGRWVNLGPLRYEPEVPIALRFTHEELFDLARRCGFQVGHWQTESSPYLVSKLNGRGKMEWKLAFIATKREEPTEPESTEGGPPAWLVFGHLPIPTFAGQSMFWSRTPAVQLVVSAIDGRRTMHDLAALVADKSQKPDVPMSQIREAVRQCVAEAHPACRA